jgi:hypothetical protein
LSHLVRERAARHDCGMHRTLVAAAVMTLACGSAAVVSHARFDNDYAAARAAAQRRHLPLAVEVWAPW